MAEITLFKAGYLIRVTTWENDADNYQTKELQLESESEVLFVLALCESFESSWKDPSKFIGNQYEYDEGVYEFLDTFADERNFDRGKTRELCNKLALMGGGEFFTRHFESAKVYFLHSDVIATELDFSVVG